MTKYSNENGSIADGFRRGEFRLPRRSVLKGGALAAAGTAAGMVPGLRAARAASYVLGDEDVLNFALNLEYLEANYYLLGVTGSPLPTQYTNGGPVPTTSGTTLVPFQTPQLAYYFQRIAADEQAHVSFLQQAIGGEAGSTGAVIAQPQIDLSASFTALAQAAGLISQGQTFNPFASEIDFIVGSYIFEDVGVTAYAGGANYLALGSASVAYAASVLAMEGYHAGAIRGYLASQGGGAVTNAISNLRATLSGTGGNSGQVADDNGTDQSGNNNGNPFTIVNSDSQGQAFRRTFGQVLSIVYAGGQSNGLFFPNGLNGTIRNSGDTFINQNG